MPDIKWLPEALTDIARLDAFLRPKSPQAATRAIHAILEQADLLRTMPSIGKPMLDDTDRRELTVPFASGAYIIRYIQEDEHPVVIIRVWHNREERTASPFP